MLFRSYKNIVNTIKYDYYEDKFVLYVEYKEFRVDEVLKKEEEYVIEAMRNALEIFLDKAFENRKIEIVN